MGIRTSIFVDPSKMHIEGAKEIGTHRIELYTESYARQYTKDPEQAIEPYELASLKAKEIGLGVNAGHDLDLKNLKFLSQKIPFIAEVSIGHALICDSLYYGLENTIQMYLRCLTH
jgi:pyridoxine 5-phosphate synthase